MVAFASAGLFAHTLFLLWRAVNTPAVPLSSAYDWYLLAAWVLAGGYLWLMASNPKTPFGLFMLPIVLGLIGAAQLSSREPFPQSPATQIWGTIHGRSRRGGSPGSSRPRRASACRASKSSR
jgi:hypothetical protein